MRGDEDQYTRFGWHRHPVQSLSRGLSNSGEAIVVIPDGNTRNRTIAIFTQGSKHKLHRGYPK